MKELERMWMYASITREEREECRRESVREGENSEWEREALTEVEKQYEKR